MQSLQAGAQELAVPELRRARARAQRLPRGARGRADDRGAGPDREPAGARRRRARVPGERGREPTLSAFLQEISLFSDQDALRGGAQPRHADDAPQREGARVPRRLPDRDGGGHLPALALDRGARDRGGAAPLLRRHDAREGAADADARGARARSGAARLQPARRFLDELPEERGRARAAAAGLVVGLRRAARVAGRSRAPTSRPLDRRLRPPRDARRGRRHPRSSRAASSPSASQTTAPSGG